MFSLNRKNIPVVLLLVFAVMLITGLSCKRDEGEVLPPEEVDLIEPGAETTPAPSSALPVSPPIGAESELERKIRALSQDFAKIWGSYSSEDDCQNVRDLLDYMSVRFRTEMEEYLEEECGQEVSVPAFSIETTVLETVILTRDEQEAEVLVVTRRMRSGDQTKRSYPNLILDLVVEANDQGQEEWRVDDAYWIEKVE